MEASVSEGRKIGATQPFTRPKAHVIKSDAEAIEIAKALAADFAKEAAARDAERRAPKLEMDKYSQSGLMGMTVPKQYGGAFVSNVTLAEVCKIISEADPSIGQIPQNHFYMVEALRLDGTEWQKKYFFDLVLQGVRFGNAFSEIGTKSLNDVQTRLTPNDGAYSCSGKKFYCTGALLADWVPVVAKDENNNTCIAYIEKGMKGLNVIDDWSSFGQKTTCSGTTVIDNVWVPKEHVIPHYKAFDRATSMGPVAQIIQAAIDAGIAHAAFKDTCYFVRNHTRPWIDTTPQFEKGYEDTLTIAAIGDMKIKLLAMDELLRRSGEVLDKCQADMNDKTVAEASIAVAVAKVSSTVNSVEFGSKLFELAGTRSTLEQYNLNRHWRNARTHTLHDPVRWKYFSIGNYYLNGVLPPRNPWV
jgi:SfnB family sulfur acquisition oxidoreductase